MIVKLLLLLGFARPPMPSVLHPIHWIQLWERSVVTGFQVGFFVGSITTLVLVCALLGLIFLLRWAIRK